MLAEVFAQVDALSKLSGFILVPFDTKVGAPISYERGQRVVWERTRGGGTSFQAPTDWLNKNAKRMHLDGAVFFTDMEAPRPGPCKVRRLWITNQMGHRNAFDTNEVIIVIPKRAGC